MKIERRKQIRELADNVRQSLGLPVPVDVDRAVAKLGGKLESVARDGQDHEAFVKANDTGFVIGVADDVPANRRRFSIAHELGHLFLHMGYLTDDWQTDSKYVDSVMYRYGYTEEEFEAHEFAGTFLMPEEQFRQKVAEFKSDDRVNLGPIAEYFRVSTDAARIRGRNLELFSWQ